MIGTIGKELAIIAGKRIKYQCYWQRTYGKKQYLGEKILDKCFDNQLDAERYCRRVVGIDKNGEEREMQYEEIYEEGDE